MRSPLHVSLFVLLSCIVFTTYAQTQRTVLIEERTSSSCPTCGSQNPAFDVLLESNESSVNLIKYQWGDSGHPDIMFDFNPQDATDRTDDFYNAFGFPKVWVDGAPAGTPNMISQTTIDNANAQQAWFLIEAEAEIEGGTNLVSVSVSTAALKNFQAAEDTALTLHIVLVEKTIEYPNPPGNNSETVFHSVMRKMLPDAYGTTIGQQSIGQSESVYETWSATASELNTDSLWVVAFIQNSATMEVHQSASTPVAQGPMSILEANEVQPSLSTHYSASMLHLSYPTQQPSEQIVRIYNTMGSLVHEGRVVFNGSQSSSMPVGQLAPGAYVVQAGELASSVLLVVK